MFTGIVETIGTITSLQPLDASISGGNGTSLTISTASHPTFLNDCQLGDSIAVNGTCLTVTALPSSTSPTSSTSTSDALPPQHFKTSIAPETLRRTNLGRLGAGDKVNLERAVQAGSTRMGGHFVQGHVDTVARVAGKRADGNAVVMRFAPREAGVLRYVVEKGFVAVDGTSLTVTAVEDGKAGWFEVMLIAYTREKVVVAEKEVGGEVNVEVDFLGKVVEKAVRGYLEEGREGLPVALERLVAKMVEEKVEEKVKVLGLGK